VSGQEGSPLELFEGLPELLLRVHHDRAVPRHWFGYGLSGDQEEPDPVVAGPYRELITIVKEYE
jgi:hypothetical protein